MDLKRTKFIPQIASEQGKNTHIRVTIYDGSSAFFLFSQRVAMLTIWGGMDEGEALVHTFSYIKPLISLPLRI